MQQKMPFDINELKDISCKCGSLLFTQIIRLKHVSKLQSPDGNEGVVKVMGLVCLECGKPEAEAMEHFEKQQREEFESKVIQFKK